MKTIPLLKILALSLAFLGFYGCTAHMELVRIHGVSAVAKEASLICEMKFCMWGGKDFNDCLFDLAKNHPEIQ